MVDLSLAAVGLWTLAGSWCASYLTDGEVTPRAMTRLGGSADMAAELVAAGLWVEEGDAYRFKDWEEYQPSKEQVEAERAAARDRQKRFRSKRKGLDGESPPKSPASHSDGNGVTSPVENGVTSEPPSLSRPDPIPSPPSTPNGVDVSSSDVKVSDVKVFSDDVERLSQLLAELVRGNEHKANVTKRWRVECDRLMRLDGYTPQQVEWVMRWACNDSFWSTNILSMGKLRESFSRLKAQAMQQYEKQKPARASSITEDNMAVVARLREKEQQRHQSPGIEA